MAVKSGGATIAKEMRELEEKRQLTQKMVVGLAFVLEGQATVRDVVEVLEPLEERHGDTTGVDVEVGNDEDVAVEEDFVGGGCCWSVGGFSDDLGLDLVRVLAGDDLFDGSGDEDVALLEHEVLAVVGLQEDEVREPTTEVSAYLSLWEANDGSVLVAVILQGLWVNALWVEDGSVVFNDADAGGASAGQVTASVETDVTEALDDEGFAAPSGSCSDLAHVSRLVDEVLDSVEDSTSGGRDATVNTALVDWFSGDASVGVDVIVSDGLGVCVGDPAHLAASSTNENQSTMAISHLPFASSHVRGWDVNAWADESLLGELKGETTGDLLQFVF
jgi:hypothetical protein